MESFIHKKFHISPFLCKFFEVCGLFNKEAIAYLEDETFLEKLKQFFLKNITQFNDFHDYLGIEDNNTQKFIIENAQVHIFDIIKPGDYAQIQEIRTKVSSMKTKDYNKLKVFQVSTKTSRYARTLK